MAIKITSIEMSPTSFGQSIRVVGVQAPQIQFEDEQEDEQIYFNVSRAEARRLAQTLIEHCDLADKQNAAKS